MATMTEYYGQQRPLSTHAQPRSYQILKTATALTAGGSFLLLCGLTLAGTVVALTIATPLLVIFSPVLVPAAIAVFLISSGFLASGGFGVAALSVLSWIFRYISGKQPLGADQLDMARDRLAVKAKEMKDKAEHFGHQYVPGSQAS